MDRQQTKSLAFIVALLLAVLPLPASAELYHCTQDGRTIISDRPCDRQSTPIRRGVEATPATQLVQAPARANVITGYVVSIADGDTITSSPVIV